MNAENILREVYARGIVLEMEGENIRFRDPSKQLTPELKDEIAKNKANILECLRRRCITASGAGMPHLLGANEFETVLDVFKTLQKWRNEQMKL